MAAFTDLADLLAAIKAPSESVYDYHTSAATVAGKMHSSWLDAGGTSGAGSAPSTAAVPARTSAGAISHGNAGSGTLWLPRVEISRSTSGMLILCDRLSHQGGLSGTSTSTQTTNLPTAALTRYTNGLGVLAALEIYSQVGTTATTATISYTNDSGTTGQVSAPVAFGGTGQREAGRFILVPFKNVSGDAGIKAVASVTLAASTTTAGNFGVTLFKPLLMLPFSLVASYHFTFDSLLNLGGQLPQILTDACLFTLFYPNSTATGSQSSRLTMTDQ